MINDDTKLTVKKIFTEYLEKKGHRKNTGEVCNS